MRLGNKLHGIPGCSPSPRRQSEGGLCHDDARKVSPAAPDRLGFYMRVPLSMGYKGPADSFGTYAGQS